MSPGDVAWRRPRGGRVGGSRGQNPEAGTGVAERRKEEGWHGWSRSAAHGAPPGTGPAGEGGRADRPSQSRSQQNQLSGFFGG